MSVDSTPSEQRPVVEVHRLVRQLPSEEGFFWWRENPSKAWRMVQVVDFASGVEDKAYLMTYDVQNHSWSGRSLKGWADHLPIGEWIHVPSPNGGTQRPGSPDGSLATETRKPGSRSDWLAIMNDWKQYKRKGLSEMRPYVIGEDVSHVSISEPDKQNGSPREGDMIARNPKNHADQWLVAKKYFEDNIEPA